MLVKMTGRWRIQTTSSWLVNSPRVDMPPPVTSRHRPFESQSGMALEVVVRLNPAVERGHHEVAMVFGLSAEGGAVRIYQEPADTGQRTLR